MHTPHRLERSAIRLLLLLLLVLRLMPIVRSAQYAPSNHKRHYENATNSQYNDKQHIETLQPPEVKRIRVRFEKVSATCFQYQLNVSECLGRGLRVD